MSRNILLLLILGALTGCDQNVGPPGAAPPTQAPTSSGGQASARPEPAATPATAAASAEAAGVVWTPPARWASQGARPMRAATYRVPAAQSDAEDGECAVFYFGSGQGGTVDANLKRWIEQFEQPGGASSEKAAKTERRTMNGLPVTTVDLSGTYLASAGPMSPVKERKPGYRLLGTIVEAPEGILFFKFTGPAATVSASAEEFQGMLQSIKRQ